MKASESGPVSQPIESPAERRRIKVRERILSAAERVFAAEGAEGLSIRRLAQKIDYSPAAIYKYFGSKDELVDELKEAFFARLLSYVDQMNDDTRPYGARARTCMAMYVQIAAEKPNHYAAAFTGLAAPTGPEDDQSGFDESKKGQAFNFLRGMIEQGIQQGHFRTDIDANSAAKSAWSSLHGLALMIAHIPQFPAMREGMPSMSQQKFIEFHADLIVRGLEGRP